MVPPSDEDDDDFDAPNIVPTPLAETEATANILEEVVNNGATLFHPILAANSVGDTTPSPPGFGGDTGRATTNGNFNHAEFSALGDDYIRQQHNIYLSQGVVVPIQHFHNQFFSRSHSWFTRDASNIAG